MFSYVVYIKVRTISSREAYESNEPESWVRVPVALYFENQYAHKNQVDDRPGCEKARDQEKGRSKDQRASQSFYYYNLQTKKTRWESPMFFIGESIEASALAT